MNSLTKKIITLTLFAIAMGFLETAVVVYLRKIYYPDGFMFPLIPIDNAIAVIEFWREAATIVMLACIGGLSGKTATQRFAYFIYCFAIWDIFYYVFLKLVLNWPESIFTWDVLFLIPVPWVGPVIAPCLVSLSMIVLTLYIVYFEGRRKKVSIAFMEWLLLGLGSFTVILSFVWNYFKFINSSATHNSWTLFGNTQLFDDISTYIPRDYNWFLFFTGELVIIYSIIKFIRRTNHE